MLLVQQNETRCEFMFSSMTLCGLGIGPYNMLSRFSGNLGAVKISVFFSYQVARDGACTYVCGLCVCDRACVRACARVNLRVQMSLTENRTNALHSGIEYNINYI